MTAASYPRGPGRDKGGTGFFGDLAILIATIGLDFGLLFGWHWLMPRLDGVSDDNPAARARRRRPIPGAELVLRLLPRVTESVCRDRMGVRRRSVLLRCRDFSPGPTALRMELNYDDRTARLPNEPTSSSRRPTPRCRRPTCGCWSAASPAGQ